MFQRAKLMKSAPRSQQLRARLASAADLLALTPEELLVGIVGVQQTAFLERLTHRGDEVPQTAPWQAESRARGNIVEAWAQAVRARGRLAARNAYRDPQTRR